jgi:hypothetical protein
MLAPRKTPTITIRDDAFTVTMMINTISTFVVTLLLVTATATSTIVCNNSIVGFNVIDPSVTPPSVRKLSRIVDLSSFATCALNIEAILLIMPKKCSQKTSAKCVQFFLDDVIVNKEKFIPFMYFKDMKNGTISQRKPPIGTHTIKACTYSDKACTKDESGCKEIKVEFLDCTGPTPTTKPPVKPPIRAPVQTTSQATCKATGTATQSATGVRFFYGTRYIGLSRPNIIPQVTIQDNSIGNWFVDTNDILDFVSKSIDRYHSIHIGKSNSSGFLGLEFQSIDWYNPINIGKAG